MSQEIVHRFDYSQYYSHPQGVQLKSAPFEGYVTLSALTYQQLVASVTPEPTVSPNILLEIGEYRVFTSERVVLEALLEAGVVYYLKQEIAIPSFESLNLHHLFLHMAPLAQKSYRVMTDFLRKGRVIDGRDHRERHAWKVEFKKKFGVEAIARLYDFPNQLRVNNISASFGRMSMLEVLLEQLGIDINGKRKQVSEHRRRLSEILTDESSAGYDQMSLKDKCDIVNSVEDTICDFIDVLGEEARIKTS